MISAKSKPPPRRSPSRARATPKRWRNGRVSEMRVGILGSGLMGGRLGTIWARAGHEVVFSYARSERKLAKLAREAKGKARAGTPGEAAREADALLLAVHWSRVDDVLKQAGDVSGKVIVTCSLPPPRALRHWPRRFRRLGSSPPSVLCRAKCCLACSQPSARPADRVWYTAATTRAPKPWRLS